MTREGILPASEDMDGDGAGLVDGGPVVANGWEPLLPPPGEIHRGPSLGLRHGGGLAIEGTGVTAGRSSPASMDRVSRGGVGLSLSAMRAVREHLSWHDGAN